MYDTLRSLNVLSSSERKGFLYCKLNIDAFFFSVSEMRLVNFHFLIVSEKVTHQELLDRKGYIRLGRFSSVKNVSSKFVHYV